MLYIKKPWAIFAKFKSSEGKEASKLIFLKDDQKLDDVLDEVAKSCSDMSDKSEGKVWLADHHVVYSEGEIIH